MRSIQAYQNNIESQTIIIQEVGKELNPVEYLAEKVKTFFQDSPFIGPSLRFEGQQNRQWKVSMMLITIPETDAPPEVLFKKGKADQVVKPVLIDEWLGYRFYRYNFITVQTELSKRVTYQVGSQKFKYRVPGYTEAANILFSSCNGIQTEKDVKKFEERGGLQRMWKAAWALHKDEPFHLNIMNGDQIYMDGIEEIEDPITGEKEIIPTGLFDIPTVKEWLKKTPKTRNKADFSIEMSNEAESFALHKNIVHFFANQGCTQFLRSIPTKMLKGDHDNHDGDGSYQYDQQNSKVMQGIRSINDRAYMLFQQHTSLDESLVDRGFLGGCGTSSFQVIDDGRIGILGVDTRFERTRDQVVSSKNYDTMFNELECMPLTTEWLVIMHEIAMIFPSFQKVGKALKKLEGEGTVQQLERRILGKIPGFLSVFGDACELTDDILDQWSSLGHWPERALFISRLCALAMKREAIGHPIRIIFEAGDFHAGVTGEVGPENADPLTDPTVMYQVVTSAIVNKPPPFSVFFAQYMKTMNEEIAPGMFARMIPITKERPVVNYENIDEITDKDIKIKKEEKPKKQILFAKRNFAVMKNYEDGLYWRLFVEPKKGDRITDLSVYSLCIKAIASEEIGSSDEYEHETTRSSEVDSIGTPVTPPELHKKKTWTRQHTPPPRIYKKSCCIIS